MTNPREPLSSSITETKDERSLAPTCEALRLADVLDLVSEMIFTLDADGVLTSVSSLSLDILGHSSKWMEGRPFSDFGDFIDRRGGYEARRDDWERPFWRRPFLAVARDGSMRHLLISALPIFDPQSNAFIGARAVAADRTLQKAHEDRLKTLSLALDQTPTAVIITDSHGVIEYVNRAFVASSGYSPEECVGHTPAIVKSGHMPPSLYRDMWRVLLTGKEWRGELYNRRKSGEGFWEREVITPILDQNGDITHFVAIKEDITERRRFEEELLRQGYEDEITGLPNRLLAMDRLEQALARARRAGVRVALISVDLDHFKRVNDAIGHANGDRILREVGQRLVSMVRPEDTVARLGGDEFCIVAGDCQPTDIEGMAQRILRGFNAPFISAGQEIFLTPSVGVSLFPDDGRNGGDLLRNVDAAVFRAKGMGRNTIQFFTPDLNERAAEHARLETALHHALDRSELRLFYQPMMDVETGCVRGAEALMRWNSPEFGPIPPDRFIPLAESNGLIVRLGSWAMSTACAQAREWRDHFGPSFRMAVNVSARQVRHHGFATMVRASISESGIAPENLEIEITESLLLDDGAPIHELLRLRDAGVRLSIDDFGTGYSALSYLRRFPVDTLKIDRSFLANLTVSGTDRTLVETIISMAHCLGLEVVAEGVETHHQLDMLKGRSCNVAQGFLFGRPMPATAFLNAVSRNIGTNGQEFLQ